MKNKANKTADPKPAAKREKAGFGWNDPRLLAGAVVALVALSVYNTIALHLIRPAGDEAALASTASAGEEPNALGDDVSNDSTLDPASPESFPDAGGATGTDDAAPSRPAVREETNRAESGSGRAPTGAAGKTASTASTKTAGRQDDGELERLFMRAEQSLSERERVLNYIFYANQFREVHRDRLSQQAREKAEQSLSGGTLARDLLSAGDALRDQGDFAAAREAYYLRLCRAQRLPHGEAARTYFRVADLFYREAMQARVEQGGGL